MLLHGADLAPALTVNSQCNYHHQSKLAGN